LPAAIVAFTSRAKASRLIETGQDPSGRSWHLYLAIESRAQDPSQDPCLEVARGSVYWVGLCVPGADLVSPVTEAHWTMDDQVVVGIAGNSTDQVRIVDRDGHAEPVALSADRGFIYFCASGCGCQISAIASLANGRTTAVNGHLGSGHACRTNGGSRVSRR
jgi:hypothetical protein